MTNRLFWKVKSYLRKHLPDFLIQQYREIRIRQRSRRIADVERQIQTQDYTEPPILIYAMRKVGSTSVWNILKQSQLPNRVFKTHNLSKAGLQKAEAYYGNWQPATYLTSLMLNNNLELIIENNWPLITIVREPIGRYISDIFQDISNVHPELIDDRGQIIVDRVVEQLQDVFINYQQYPMYAREWFDLDFKQAVGVDVYQYPFDHVRGYQVIKQGENPILILRTEDLKKNMDVAINDFLSTDYSFDIFKSNVGHSKPYAERYETVLERFSLPESVSASVYQSKFAQHFYQKEELATFARHWAM